MRSAIEGERKVDPALDSAERQAMERERKSATAILDSAKRQIEGQKVLLRNAEDQLAASKE